MRYARDGPDRPPTITGGDGRTYSGDCSCGQVARAGLFGRQGRTRGRCPARLKIRILFATLFKARCRRAWRGGRRTWLSTPRSARRAIAAPGGLDHARGRFCGAALRGAGPVVLRRQADNRGSQHVAGEAAAGVFARRAQRPALRSGVAPRPDRRHQIRAVASTAAAR